MSIPLSENISSFMVGDTTILVAFDIENYGNVLSARNPHLKFHRVISVPLEELGDMEFFLPLSELLNSKLRPYLMALAPEELIEYMTPKEKAKALLDKLM